MSYTHKGHNNYIQMVQYLFTKKKIYILNEANTIIINRGKNICIFFFFVTSKARIGCVS